MFLTNFNKFLIENLKIIKQKFEMTVLENNSMIKRKKMCKF